MVYIFFCLSISTVCKSWLRCNAPAVCSLGWILDLKAIFSLERRQIRVGNARRNWPNEVIRAEFIVLLMHISWIQIWLYEHEPKNCTPSNYPWCLRKIAQDRQIRSLIRVMSGARDPGLLSTSCCAGDCITTVRVNEIECIRLLKILRTKFRTETLDNVWHVWGQHDAKCVVCIIQGIVYRYGTL